MPHLFVELFFDFTKHWPNLMRIIFYRLSCSGRALCTQEAGQAMSVSVSSFGATGIVTKGDTQSGRQLIF